MPASTTVPAFMAGIHELLTARPNLAGVSIRLTDGRWQDREAIVLSRVSMNAATFLGWGSGPDSLATVEPLTLSGYAFAEVGNDPAAAAAAVAAYNRVGTFIVEILQQLRDDPTIADALMAPQRLQPPLMLSALWGTWPADDRGVGTTAIRVDFTIAWQAITA